MPTSGDQPQPAEDRMGLGSNDPVYPFALHPIAGVRDVVKAAAGSACFAVLSDGRILAWGETGSGELGITPPAEFEANARPRARTNTPTPLAVRFDAVDVSSKSDHVLRLLATVLCTHGAAATAGSSASGRSPSSTSRRK
jgi:hypothetical protein